MWVVVLAGGAAMIAGLTVFSGWLAARTPVAVLGRSRLWRAGWTALSWSATHLNQSG